MTQVACQTDVRKIKASAHLKKIVDHICKKKPRTQKMNKELLLATILNLMENISPEKILSTPTREMEKRIEKIAFIESTAGILNKLKPQNLESFHRAGRRRLFFK